MTVRILGIRHHSPACARLVQRIIERDRPAAVLIEGPADFNPRLGELLLDHQLPVALYSYANHGERPAQCWFPFLSYSPEWAALRGAQACGALLRFIDLPHWQYRAISDDAARPRAPDEAAGRSRYALAVQALCDRFGCDGSHALWDQLFEDVGDDGVLQERLDLYFHELRGDEAGTPQDQARELQMARWVAWAQAQVQGDVLVVCGGWHQRAIASLWPAQTVAEEPVTLAPDDVREAGCYLVPYAWRQVDALGGYGAGMQSPMFYQWLWEHGLPAAGERAIGHIVRRLRTRDVVVSTADLVAMRQTLAGLAQLRGRSHPLRGDILDALQACVIKEALEVPPPWSEHGVLHGDHHPVLREALLALTGEGAGRLHAQTPLPPLVHDVQTCLAACGVTPRPEPQTLVLDRRRAEDLARAELLWRLHLIGVQGARLTGTQAPRAARSLPEALRFEEHWSLQQDDRWFPDLIEAAAYGATLESAARNHLAQDVRAAQGNVALAAQCLLQAVRAGLHDMGAELALQLRAAVAAAHDLGALADAARVLLEVVEAGFWGQDTRALLEAAVGELAARILLLLEDRQGASQGAAMQADVAAVGVLAAMLRLRLTDGAAVDAALILATLQRLAFAATTPPALRGAALAACHVQGALGADAAARILAVLRSIPARDALGDFLFGLFSLARALASESPDVVAAVHEALENTSHEDFLVALPQLRAAFAWFPPRERSVLAAQVARLLGLSGTEEARLLTLASGTEGLLDAKAIEAQALAWARALGIAE